MFEASTRARALAWALLLALIHGIARDAHAATPGELDPRDDLSVAVFERVSPAVVFITNLGIRRSAFSLDATLSRQGCGSGFFIDRRGHILTNYHVVHRAAGLLVKRAGEERGTPARVVGVAPEKDLALLKIEVGSADSPYIELGSSADLKVGRTVLAIGNPFGLDHSMTRGIVSALGREIKSMTGRVILDVIQTDAAINPGNSGGPLLDLSGKLVGVNTAIYSPSGASSGIGFAVPVDTVKSIVPQLLEFGRVVCGQLGARFLPDAIARRARLRGAVVASVDPGGAAERAGMRGLSATHDGGVEPGDVVVAIDGTAVASGSHLLSRLDRFRPGQRIRLGVERRGARRSVDVVLREPDR